MAVRRVSNPEIERAINEWGGNVTAAAADLGLHPKNLRERLARLGVDLEAIRAGRTVIPGGAVRVARPDTYGTVRNVSAGTYGPKSVPGTLPESGAPPTLSRVPATIAEKDQVEDVDAESPVRPSSTPAKALRVKPRHQEMIRAGKVELIARYRRDFDEQDIFEQFLDEDWPEFLRRKLNPAAPPRAKKAGKEKLGGAGEGER
jgi:hypothetical protein